VRLSFKPGRAVHQQGIEKPGTDRTGQGCPHRCHQELLRFCSELQEHDPEVFLNLIEDHMLAFFIQPESWK